MPSLTSGFRIKDAERDELEETSRDAARALQLVDAGLTTVKSRLKERQSEMKSVYYLLLELVLAA